MKQIWLIAFVCLWKHTLVSGGIIQNYVKCLVDTDITQEEFKKYRALQLPESKAGKCFMACLMKSVGIMDTEGKISTTSIMDIVKSYTSDEVSIGNVETAVLQCSGEVNEVVDDSCISSFLFNRCIMEKRNNLPKTRKFPEINFTLPPITIVLAFLSLL